MNKNQYTHAPKTDQQTDQSEGRAQQSESWDALLERIAALAHRRSKSLLTHTDEDDDAFDRGARSLRTLMSSAELAHRLKRDETKESQADDEGAQRQPITEAAIDAAYRTVSDRIDRLEREESERQSSGDGSKNALVENGSAAGSGERAGGAALEGQRP